jgi:hypothetical protein
MMIYPQWESKARWIAPIKKGGKRNLRWESER